MLQAARAMGLRRWLIQVPVLSPRLSSFWLVLFTTVPFRVAAALVEGLKSETIVQNDNAGRYFPEIRPMGYIQAVKRALEELEQHQVVSRWCDSSADIACDITAHDDPGGSILRDVNRQNLAARGVVIYLHCSPEQQFSRTNRDRNRPLLQTEDPLERLRQLMDEREPLYRQVADLVVSTEKRGTASVVKEIRRRLETELS